MLRSSGGVAIGKDGHEKDRWPFTINVPRKVSQRGETYRRLKNRKAEMSPKTQPTEF